jgi:translation initiation factor 5B
LKADTLGSLEAAAGLFRKKQIPIRKASVGAVTKQDVMDALAAREVDEYSGQICAFNVKILPDAEQEALNQGIAIFASPVIYRVVEEYREYMERRRNEEIAEVMSELIMPGKMRLIPRYLFRRSNPVIIGVEVLGGVIVPKMRLMNQEGEIVGTLHSITSNNKPIKEARKGEEVAISINGAVWSRNIQEDDILYIDSPESHIRQLRTRFREELTEDELKALIDFVKIKRTLKNPYWAA